MHSGGIITRVFSVGIGVVIGAILIKPDILLWIPALNSPHVDTNVGVITILLAVLTIVRDGWQARQPATAADERAGTTVTKPTNQALAEELEWLDLLHDAGLVSDAEFQAQRQQCIDAAQRREGEAKRGRVSQRVWGTMDLLLRGTVMMSAMWFFVRLWVV